MTATKFSYPSYRSLYRFMGETDAMVEFTELATRSFIYDANNSKDVGLFLRTQAQLHGIHVNLSEFDNLPRHLVKSYLVVAFAAAESFLRDFKDEYEQFFKTKWCDRVHGQDSLSWVLTNISNDYKVAESRIGRDLISRFQYYREVRNWVVHGSESDLKGVNKAYKAIIEHTGDIKHFFASAAAPNPPSNLSFHDFVYFSRITKLIAERICELAIPSFEQLIAMCEKEDIAGRFQRRFTNNDDRVYNAVVGFLRSQYGMDDEAAGSMARILIGSLA